MSQEVASAIIVAIGGADNILSLGNCMTRIRCTIKNVDLIKYDDLEAMVDVINVIRGEHLQIVVGPGKSGKITDIMKEQLGLLDWKSTKQEVVANQAKASVILKQIANIFTPLIPAIIGAGLLNGIAGYCMNVLTSQGITEVPLWILFLQTMGAGLFSYFAIYVGINAANEFGATPGLGGIIGAITISPNINVFSERLGLFNAEVPLNSILTTGKGGIIGVIAGVALLAFIEKRLRKIIPDVVTTFFTPIISLSIVSGLLIFCLMPLAGVVSDGIIMVFSYLIMSEGIVSIIGGFILAASFLPLLMVGLHHGLIPFYMVQLEQSGAISLFPILCMAGAAQVGSAIAVYVKAPKNNKLRNIIRSSLPVGFLGIGEPLLYGVTIPLGKPFITASIGGGIAGMFVAYTKVQSIAFGPAGLSAVPLIVPDKMLYFVLGLCIAYISGFLITYICGVPKNVNDM